MQVTGTQLWMFLYDTREKVSAAWYASEHEPRPRSTRSHSFDRYYPPSKVIFIGFAVLFSVCMCSIVIRTIPRQLRTFARTKTLFLMSGHIHSSGGKSTNGGYDHDNNGWGPQRPFSSHRHKRNRTRRGWVKVYLAVTNEFQLIRRKSILRKLSREINQETENNDIEDALKSASACPVSSRD